MNIPVGIGDVVANKYRVVRELGRGGMGVVFAAEHLQLPQTVAIKFLLGGSESPTAAARFEREARTVVRLRSEHVCRVFDVGSLPTGEPFIVMELLEGRDLSEVLHERGTLPIAEAVDYLLQAGEAVMEAHSMGVVHRDLKPSNLFLSRRVDGTGIVKVLDFGISKTDEATDHRELTQSGAVLGSPRFMAPEQLVSAKEVTPQTDVWALGVVLHELLSGQATFDGGTPAELFVAILQHPPAPLDELRPDLPPGLVAAVEGALEKDAHDRYPNVAAFAVALAPFAPAHAQARVEGIVRMAQATGWTPPRATGQTTRAAGSRFETERTAQGTLLMAAVAGPAPSEAEDAPAPRRGAVITPPEGGGAPMGAHAPVAAHAATMHDTGSSPPAPPYAAPPHAAPPHAGPTHPAAPAYPAAPSLTADAPIGRRSGLGLGLALGAVVAVVALGAVAFVALDRGSKDATEDRMRSRAEDDEAPAPRAGCPFDFCDHDFRLSTTSPADPIGPLDTVRRKVESKLQIDDPELTLLTMSGLIDGKFHPTDGAITYGFRYEGAGGRHEMVQAFLTPLQLALRRASDIGQAPLETPACPLAKALEAAYADGFPQNEMSTAMAFPGGDEPLWQLATNESGLVRYVDDDCGAATTFTPVAP